MRPGGTATGKVPCGEVLGVSVVAGLNTYSYYPQDETFQIYLPGGNVDIAGIGVTGEGEFTGDVLVPARFIRPESDGVDCTQDTLVLRILTPAAEPAYDFETGAIVSESVLGSAELSVE